jgi:aminoglycoside phosphotransferase (APT) family kinase protein
MNSAQPAAVVRADAGGRRSFQRPELTTAMATLFGRTRASRIVDLEAWPLPYASSFAIDEVTVRFDDGTTLELVCKGTGKAAMLPEARRIKPRFVHHPLREIATYERILAPFGAGAPRFYGSVVNRQRGDYWLFLERVRGVPLTEVGDFAVWRHVSSWLGEVHARLARDPGLADAAALVPLVRYDQANARVWMERAQRHLEADAVRSRSVRRRFASLMARYDTFLDELSALPSGFVHGEFFAANVLVEIAAGRRRVRPVDWELAGIGPMLMDLAALSAGSWTDDEREELAASYRGAVGQHPAAVSTQEFTRALDCCRLQLAIQRLGWAQEWTPPATHRQDWLGEALHAADRLGL